MNKKIFFAGTGNMGGAILRGLLQAGSDPKTIFFFDPSDTAAAAVTALGCVRVKSFDEGVKAADVTFLCVKPQIFKKVSGEWNAAAKALTAPKTFISIMAGVARSALVSVLGEQNQVLRVMPNLPLTVGKGTVALATDGVNDETLATAETIFGTVGVTCRVSESLMDAVTGLSGSAPAYVFEFIEGLTRGGVKAGLTRDVALKLALGTIEGSVELVKQSGKSPSDLCAMVCSPAGTTIAGVDALEEGGFRSSLIKAVVAGTNRSKELGK
ncbi:MAG: pyrroline-5-carboxylate reductase [Fibrobacter sp.]|uniref:pyrroline-5-carboxylate reductase n=1 Tax=Fibrobacter sp. UWP2 TaxID=1896216 RepID=UPI0009194154|nr:pyrroline-5-carboxylate reductase [Fibrobacter sp. UWP2]MBO7384131.1 pyrroline-5-carboxylate reductase [Fibrobacter sp.]SHI46700.1 pyrroline-5-carboxylate reductase [Fibrobacter sp. UWP2]